MASLVSEEVERAFVLKLFGGVHRSYDRILTMMTLGRDGYWKQTLISKMGSKSYAIVVDLAAGTGVLTRRLADTIGKGLVLGIDVSEAMLKMARNKKSPSEPKRSIELSVAEAESLPLRSETAELITACYLLKYCNLSRTLSEAMRVLKKGGRLIAYDFTTPDRTSFGILCYIYIFGLIPLLSRIAPHRGLRFMLSNLPKIIRTRRWDLMFMELASKEGFVNLKMLRLTGGVVTLVQAEKPTEAGGVPPS